MERRWPLTQSEIETYVAKLDPQVQAIYQKSQMLLISLGDTLEDDFQIAAAINTVFQMYAFRRLSGQ